MNDTAPEVAKIVRQQLLARSGAERVRMGDRMFDVARLMVLASFPAGLSAVERKVRLCERMYGKEVDVQAFRDHLYRLESETKGT